jgi:hypothetical protein
LLIPLVFNWYSLVRGNSIMRTPEISFGGVHTYFNVRYGMMMLPIIALFFAYLATRIRLAAIAALMPVLVFAVAGTLFSIPYVLQDPVIGSAGVIRVQKQEAAWLAAHCAKGQTLISESGFPIPIFYSRIPLSHLLTDGSHDQFQAAMAHPERAATCLAMDSQADNFEPVWDGLHKREDWRPYFKLAAQFGSASFYQRINAPTSAAGAAPPDQPAANSPPRARTAIAITPLDPTTRRRA